MKRMISEAMKLEVKKMNKGPTLLGDIYNVGEYVVRIFNKPGRRLITCTCFNGTKWCSEPVLCKHKLAVIKFIMEVK